MALAAMVFQGGSGHERKVIGAGGGGRVSGLRLRRVGYI